MSNTLDKLMPRCKTKDKDDFPDIKEDERCWNCEVWEAIDLHTQEAYKKGYIDGGIKQLTNPTEVGE